MSATITAPIQRTQEFFRTQYDIELTDEQARDANARITQIFLLLEKWYSANPVPVSAIALPDAESHRESA